MREKLRNMQDFSPINAEALIKPKESYIFEGKKSENKLEEKIEEFEDLLSSQKKSIIQKNDQNPPEVEAKTGMKKKKNQAGILYLNFLKNSKKKLRLTLSKKKAQ